MQGPVKAQRIPHPAWIEVAGFKSLRNPVRVHLRPLTLLAGANSSGKSSLFQPLLLLKQSLDASFEPGPLLLHGDHLRFTRLDQLLSGGKKRADRVDRFYVSFGPPVGPSRLLKQMVPLEIKAEFRRKGHRSEALDASVWARREGDSEWVELVDESREHFIAWMGLDDVGGAEVVVHRSREVMRTISVWPRRRVPHRPLLPTTHPFEWTLTALHLPGLRGHRERRYPITHARRHRRWNVVSVDGPFTPYAASMILEWQQRERQGHPKLKKLAEWLGPECLNLTWKVKAKAANAAELALFVGRTASSSQGGASDLVEIADVGFGVSQVLPLLVALAAAGSGQLVIVEQPELHLHPSAQRAIARILVETASRGVIVMVETHSLLVLRAIQEAVAEEKIAPSDVGLYWFTRSQDQGVTEVIAANVERDGTFGDWPVDFPDVYAQADDAFVEAVYNRGRDAE